MPLRACAYREPDARRACMSVKAVDVSGKLIADKQAEMRAMMAHQ
jgi:hypothetical protein